MWKFHRAVLNHCVSYDNIAIVVFKLQARTGESARILSASDSAVEVAGTDLGLAHIWAPTLGETPIVKLATLLLRPV